MKKQLFLTAMAALVMVSCSEENVLDTNKGNAIDFRAAMATRAQETTTVNMSSIYVTAMDARNENLFSDQLFSKMVIFYLYTCLLLAGRWKHPDILCLLAFKN